MCTPGTQISLYEREKYGFPSLTVHSTLRLGENNFNEWDN